jgi:histidinol phosphatase-like PHP family hydrolase
MLTMLAALAATATAARADDPDPVTGERWLRGSTHVHAKPSGDSRTPVDEVITWYEEAGYDFIVLSDHNRVSEIAPARSTAGRPAVLDSPARLLVIAGTELTFNPDVCLPSPPESGKRCRIHATVIAATARPAGRLEWADRQTDQRELQYARALTTAAELGGVAQVNHPLWHWGLSSEVLARLAGRGLRLVEIANVQFDSWNAGKPGQPSMLAVWDGALRLGARVWGVASDDAHHHDEDGRGQYPAGGGWVVVRARRDAGAIRDALLAGRFYASTGVALTRVEVVDGQLAIDVADEPGTHVTRLIVDGAVVARVAGRQIRFPLPSAGYVRAEVVRDDGARAFTQPVWAAAGAPRGAAQGP